MPAFPTNNPETDKLSFPFAYSKPASSGRIAASLRASNEESEANKAQAGAPLSKFLGCIGMEKKMETIIVNYIGYILGLDKDNGNEMEATI